MGDAVVSADVVDVNELIDDAGVPRWDEFAFEVRCSRCGYNLMMLTTPRCPECGLEFDWPAVLNRARHQSPFLFEHNWRRRAVLSLLSTIWRSLWPRRFWGSVSIHARVHVGALLFVSVVGVSLALVLFHGLAWLLATALGPLQTQYLPFSFVYQLRQSSWYDRLIWFLEEIAYPSRSIEELVVMPLWVLCLVIGTFLMLASLRQTLGACRIRAAQLFRVWVYSATAYLVLSTLLFFTVFCVFQRFPSFYLSTAEFIKLALISVVIMAILPWYLGIGLRDYLQMPRPFLHSFVCWGIGLLLAATVNMALDVWG